MNQPESPNHEILEEPAAPPIRPYQVGDHVVGIFKDKEYPGRLSRKLPANPAQPEMIWEIQLDNPVEIDGFSFTAMSFHEHKIILQLLHSQVNNSTTLNIYARPDGIRINLKGTSTNLAINVNIKDVIKVVLPFLEQNPDLLNL